MIKLVCGEQGMGKGGALLARGAYGRLGGGEGECKTVGEGGLHGQG